MSDTIPAVVHFIWLGASLPWHAAIAAMTAARRGGLHRVTLHHDGDLAGDAFAAVEAAGIETRRIDPLGLCEAAAGPRLADVYRLLDGKPAARSDVLRAAILLRDGGVYLDCDTITVRPLLPLCAAEAFAGEERIVFPPDVMRSRRPDVLLGAAVRHAVRDVLRRVPGGWRAFRRIEGAYHLAVNNAILAASPGHPLIARLVAHIVGLPRAAHVRPYALGPHALAAAIAGGPAAGLVVHPPAVFYPLGPEIAEHWVRPAPGPHALRLLLPETRVVHWYASTRTRRRVRTWTLADLPALARSQPLAWLAWRALAPDEWEPA